MDLHNLSATATEPGHVGEFDDPELYQILEMALFTDGAPREAVPAAVPAPVPPQHQQYSPQGLIPTVIEQHPREPEFRVPSRENREERRSSGSQGGFGACVEHS